jgi:predicted phosphodiesterase
MVQIHTRNIHKTRGNKMKSDYELIIKHIPINSDIKIYPISDLHIGASEFLHDKWTDFKKQILKEPNSFITIGGDMMNNATRNSVTNIFAETMRPSDQKKWLAAELADIKDKILCVVPGNHEARSGKDADDDPLYDVCAKLDIEDLYRENIAFIKIAIGQKEGDGRKNPTYTLAVLHGAGGGIYTGASVNRNERTGYYIDGLDCLIVGHSHKGAITKPQKISIDPFNNKVSFKQFVVISSTSWLEYGGYALKKTLIPASNDIQTVILAGNQKKIETLW